MENTPEQLQLFYNSLENIKSFSIWNILREIKVLDKTDKSWEEKILTERKVFSYNINKGKITSNTQTTDIKGKVRHIRTSKIRKLVKAFKTKHFENFNIRNFI